MIATLAEVKQLLGITDASKDAQLTAIIPMVESDLIQYCYNLFLNSAVSFGGACTTTVSGATYKLECSDGGMDNAGFEVGDTVYISGTIRNDGYYTISGIADGYIQTVEPLYADSEARSVTASQAVFPSALKIYLAKMAGYQLFSFNDSGVTSETIGNYSYSRSGSVDADYGYPAQMLKGLDKWRLASLKSGSVLPQFRDLRGCLSGSIRV